MQGENKGGNMNDPKNSEPGRWWDYRVIYWHWANWSEKESERAGYGSWSSVFDMFPLQCLRNIQWRWSVGSGERSGQSCEWGRLSHQPGDELWRTSTGQPSDGQEERSRKRALRLNIWAWQHLEVEKARGFSKKHYGGLASQRGNVKAPVPCTGPWQIPQW